MTKPSRTPGDQPHHVDIQVGKRIRARRKMIGMSQTTLADGLGLTFQQVQKYERGANRVSASKLYDIAAAMGAPISWFFDDLDAPESGAAAVADPTLTAFVACDGALRLAHVLPLLTRSHRAALIRLAVAMAPDAADEGEAGDAAHAMPLAGGADPSATAH